MKTKKEMSRAKKKKGISVIIGYVLLVSFAVILGVLIYSWMEGMNPGAGVHLECPDEISIFVKSYDCSSDQITLDLMNNGRFNIGGYFIRATTSPQQEIATLDISRNATTPGTRLFPTGIKFGEVGDEKNSLITGQSEIEQFDLTGTYPIYSVQITPIIWKEEDNQELLVTCSESKIIENIKCSVECTPRTCEGLAYDCGTWSDNCGGTITCGDYGGGCEVGECNSFGQCVLTPSFTPSWQNNGLILWLKLDGNSLDSSSSNWDTTEGGVTYTTGKIGQAATGFSETNKISVDPDLDYASTNMTIAFWIYVNDHTTPARQNPLGKAFGGDGTITLESYGGMNFYFGNAGADDYDYTSYASASATNGTWEHWIIIRDRTSRTRQWYKNGIAPGPPASYDSLYDPVHSTNYLTIGDNYESPLNGRMDEVMIWNRVLNSTEIQEVYNYNG
jgi:hypothetical protein